MTLKSTYYIIRKARHCSAPTEERINIKQFLLLFPLLWVVWSPRERSARSSWVLTLGPSPHASCLSLKHRGDASPPGREREGGSCSAAPVFKDHLFWSWNVCPAIHSHPLTHSPEPPLRSGLSLCRPEWRRWGYYGVTGGKESHTGWLRAGLSELVLQSLLEFGDHHHSSPALFSTWVFYLNPASFFSWRSINGLLCLW